MLTGPIPIFAFGLLMHLTKNGPYSVAEMILYPLILGSAGIFWINWISLRWVGISILELNFKSSTWYFDILTAIFLTPLLFLILHLERLTIYRWLSSSNMDAMNLIRSLAENPFLLLVWLGPTVWIGIAMFEEVARCFILKRLWDTWDSNTAKWTALLGTSLLIGILHLYQGNAGVAGIAILSFLKGIYYLYFGRIWPLIIAHALFDSIQIILVVRMVSSS